MRRRAFDAIVSWVGVVVTASLLVAGTLMMVGYAYTNGSVRHELAAQQIFFPAAGSPALASPDIGPFLNKYAGQQLVTGAQAKAYADHFIAVHVKAAAGGQTYAQLSTQAQANPTDTALKAQVDTLFKGETLRGLLLNAYAFWFIGQLALLGAVAAFVMAAIAGFLTALGFRHSNNVSPHQTVLAPVVPVAA
jgi:hypothetical protein